MTKERKTKRGRSRSRGPKKRNREKMILKAEVAWDLRRQLFDTDRGRSSLAFGL
jgi:hypothetical protein